MRRSSARSGNRGEFGSSGNWTTLSIRMGGVDRKLRSFPRTTMSSLGLQRRKKSK